MDDRTFRNAMGRFATGVTIVTTQVGDDTHGMTANAFMSVSLDPKLVTISIDHNARMYERIKASGQFAVSILTDEQKEVSMHFAGQKMTQVLLNLIILVGFLLFAMPLQPLCVMSQNHLKLVTTRYLSVKC